MLFSLLLKKGVVSVFDHMMGSFSFELLGYLSALGAYLFDQGQKDEVFFFRPLFLLGVRVIVVRPPLSALRVCPEKLSLRFNEKVESDRLPLDGLRVGRG